MKKTSVVFFAVALLLAVFLSACQPRVVQVVVTATPEPATVTPTPPPAATPTPEPTATLTPTITPDRAATQTAVVQARMSTELQEYGLTAEKGHLAWDGKLVYLTAKDYMETAYMDIVEEPVRNFILKANVKWSTTSGLAGCTIFFRRDGEYDTENRYNFAWMRLQGAPAWDLERVEYGDFKSYVSYQFYFDDIIRDEKGAVNEMVLKAVDDKFTVWINGKQMQTYSDQALEQGKISFAAWQETGETTCTYSDGWLWIMDE